MTFLIAKQLSLSGIKFIEFSGRVPVPKRQKLIDEFHQNPDCKVFLSTDAGSTGLNLQAADCVINFELPWNPAKLNQRIGRVHRLGQKSTCINVINFISKFSIEEKIMAGLQLKSELFSAVFEEGNDEVVFSREKRLEWVNRLREMIGEVPEPVVSDPTPSEEIPEEMPHFLNPEILRETEDEAAATTTHESEPAPFDSETSVVTAKQEETTEKTELQPAAPPPPGPQPEHIEQVLNEGMNFMSGLMKLATGQGLVTDKKEERMVRVDRQTGEVTLKFKLPGMGTPTLPAKG